MPTDRPARTPDPDGGTSGSGSGTQTPLPAVSLPTVGSTGPGGWLLGSELLTLFRRRRTQAILAVLAGIPVLLGVALRVFPAPRPGEGPPVIDQVTQNGVVEAERTDQLVERFLARFDIHQQVVRFVHLGDRMGELAPAPVFRAVNRTA